MIFPYSLNASLPFTKNLSGQLFVIMGDFFLEFVNER